MSLVLIWSLTTCCFDLQAWSPAAGYCLQNGSLPWTEWVSHAVKLLYQRVRLWNISSRNFLSCRGAGTNLQILQSERAWGAKPRWAERLSRPEGWLCLSEECTAAVRSCQRWMVLLPVLQCSAPLLHLSSWGDRRRTPLLRRCSPYPPSWMCLWCWSLLGNDHLENSLLDKGWLILSRNSCSLLIFSFLLLSCLVDMPTTRPGPSGPAPPPTIHVHYFSIHPRDLIY